MSNRGRTRYERELIKVLSVELGEEWFGQRGAHSDGVDVLMFKSLETHPILFMGLRIEVKSKNEPYPMYLSEREREQYFKYKKLFDERDVETVYAVRKVGGTGEKWRFCHLSDFSYSKNGNPMIRQEDTMPMTAFITQILTINGECPK